MTENQDLKLASTDELIYELTQRSGSGVVAITRPHKVDPKLNTYKLRWWGDGFKAAGLATAVIGEINSDRVECEDKISPENF